MRIANSLRCHGRRVMTSLAVLLLALSLSACLGTAVGAVVDVAIEVVKVPFKVGGAVIDVVRGDDDDEKDRKDKNKDKDEK